MSGSVRVVDRRVTPGSVGERSPDELDEQINELSQFVDAELDGPTVLEQYTQYCKALGVKVEIDIPCFGCSKKSMR